MPTKLFILILLIATGCVSEKGRPKIEYNGKMKYFTDGQGYEHKLESQSDNEVLILLPRCYQAEKNDRIGWTETNTFYCDRNNAYFSVDQLAINELSHHFPDYLVKRIQAENFCQYIGESKGKELLNAKLDYKSSHTEMNKKLWLASLSGTHEESKEELFFQFGVIEIGDYFYLLQSLVSGNTAPFLKEDIITIFKSFEG